MDKKTALQLAKDAYSSSTSYVDSSLRPQWDKNLRQFQSRHPLGSKYLSKAYRHRANRYRPKTRAAVRSSEAAAAAAFFSTEDLVRVSANNPDNPVQVMSSQVNQYLLQYRLENTIPWFLTVCGAWQDAKVNNVCVAHCDWTYKEVPETRVVPMLINGEPVYDEDGEEILEEIEEIRVLEDKPVIDLIPVENMRIDPAANWMDPINTSPYVIELIPMYVCDVKEKMHADDEKTGDPEWFNLSDEELRSGIRHNLDTTRQTRDNNREDPQKVGAGAGSQDVGSNEALNDYETIWVHKNIFKDSKGTDWCFYTIGTEHMLSNPVKLEEVYLHGRRPYVWGFMSFETHRTYSSSPVEQTSDLQSDINELANSRFDNVKLALNPRRVVRTGANVDYAALRELIPGGTIPMKGDPSKDLSWDRPPDVTGGAYEEQNHLNVDFDELMGVFSQSSAQTNRNMNDTVGGMNLLSAGSSAVTEYDLRIFSTTFVEPVLRQLMLLEQYYETDITLLSIAGEKAPLFAEYSGDQNVQEAILSEELNVKVDVGISSTNPLTQLQRMQMGIGMIGQIFGPEFTQSMLDPKTIVPEIMGKVGYRDGRRFFRDLEKDPIVMQLQQQNQQLQQVIETKQIEEESRMKRMLTIQQMKNQEAVATEKIKGEYALEEERVKQEGGARQSMLELLTGGGS